MQKTATIHARIELKLKTKAENILHKAGLSMAAGIRLFYKHICLQKGLPFEIKIPNNKTLKAMKAANKNKTSKAKNMEELFKDLNS